MGPRPNDGDSVRYLLYTPPLLTPANALGIKSWVRAHQKRRQERWHPEIRWQER
jgi:hypothetical protein